MTFEEADKKAKEINVSWQRGGMCCYMERECNSSCMAFVPASVFRAYLGIWDVLKPHCNRLQQGIGTER